MTNPNPQSSREAEVEYDETGRWQRLIWRLSGPELRQALPRQGLGNTTRTSRWPGVIGVLVLSDVHMLEDGLLATNVLARAEPAGEGLSLEVLVTIGSGMAPALVCRLTTNARSHSVPLTSTAAVFTHVRPAEIDGGRTLSLERSGSAA